MLLRPFVRTCRGRIVHCTHHKAGTVWFASILRAVAEAYGYTLVVQESPAAGAKAEIIVDGNSTGAWDSERQLRATHMIRDPRDMVVSGYFYHLWADEPWLLKPNPRYGGLSYRDYLNSVDRQAGLLAEIEWFSRTTAPRMQSWRYDDPRFLELKYRDVIGQPDEWFPRIFAHYGFVRAELPRLTEIAVGHTLRPSPNAAVVARPTPGRHVRSGQPGQWKEIFQAQHNVRFQELMGGLLLRLGYSDRFSG